MSTRRNAIGRALGAALMAAANTPASANAQIPDDGLKIYAVHIVKSSPFEKPFTGDGIYLGQGIVITAAHVVGRWPFFTRPHVLIGGRDLPAKVVKAGSFERIDLALLSVDESKLPVSLLLRRNPICTGGLRVGTQVINVTPENTTRSQVISPLSVLPRLRARFSTLIVSPEVSGSGLFEAESKCLLGIMSAKVQKYNYQKSSGRNLGDAVGYAGYFVPAPIIAKFIPSDIHL